MRRGNIVLLIKRENGQPVQISLGLKKRGFGANKWNGYGGKLEANESPKQAAIRELREETGVITDSLNKVAELDFKFPDKLEWSQIVDVYLADTWQGEPHETEEMRPQWFAVSEIPYGQMWEADFAWLSEVLAAKKINAEFVYDNNNILTSKNIKTVTGFMDEGEVLKPDWKSHSITKLLKRHWLLIFAIIYLVWPLDIIPDVLAPFGFVDDSIVMLIFAAREIYLTYQNRKSS